MTKLLSIQRQKGMAISQIILLIVGIIAISYALGSGVKEVSAVDPAEIAKAAAGIANNGPLVPPPTNVLPTETIADVAGQFGGQSLSSSTIVPFETVPGSAASTINLQGALTVLGNFAIAAVLAFAVYFGLQALGVNKDALLPTSLAVGLGYFLGSTFASGISGALGLTGLFASPLVIGLGVGAILGGIVLLFTYRQSEHESIIFNCNPWQPPAGGADCNKCGNGILACTKYQCMSLGAGCQLLNEGKGDERCTWVNRNDVNPPLITPWVEALKEDYKYSNDNTVSPPDKGVLVQYKPASDNCVPAFSQVKFGIHLEDENGNEKLGMCRVSTTPKDSYDKMEIPLNSLEYLSNHTIQLSLPGKANAKAEGLDVLQEGQNTLYVRCKSTNGVANIGNFVIKFCVDKGPDTTPAEIVATTPINEMPIQHGLTSIDADFYVNEPSECRWSHGTDKTFDSMEGAMTCATSITSMSYISGQTVYRCKTTLTGLTDADNKFYVKCKDQPIGTAEADRNTNSQSYIYTLKGTQSLVVSSAGPSGLVKGPGSSIKVTLTAETSAGFNDGKASCYYNERCYSNSGNENNYVQFSYPAGTALFSQFKHSQELYLSAGSYGCSIKCVDLGGNSDTKTISYSVESDAIAPFVARVYYESPDLKIITNEPATCVYDTSSCSYNFADGLPITTIDGINHNTEWDARSTFYIKCKDNYGNQPAPNVCSLIVRPV